MPGSDNNILDGIDFIEQRLVDFNQPVYCGFQVDSALPGLGYFKIFPGDSFK